MRMKGRRKRKHGRNVRRRKRNGRKGKKMRKERRDDINRREAAPEIRKIYGKVYDVVFWKMTQHSGRINLKGIYESTREIVILLFTSGS